jgi:hypothetical protein
MRVESGLLTFSPIAMIDIENAEVPAETPETKPEVPAEEVKTEGVQTEQAAA